MQWNTAKNLEKCRNEIYSYLASHHKKQELYFFRVEVKS